MIEFLTARGPVELRELKSLADMQAAEEIQFNVWGAGVHPKELLIAGTSRRINSHHRAAVRSHGVGTGEGNRAGRWRAVLIRVEHPGADGAVTTSCETTYSVDAVHRERVRVQIGLHRSGGGGPDALFVLGHGKALSDAGDGYVFGIGRAQAEGHLAGGGNFR